MKQPEYMEQMFFLHALDAQEDVPRKIYIEPTSMCNLKCSICFRHGWINEKMGRMIESCFDKLNMSLTNMESVQEIFFGGMGEPLFHPDICEMVRKLPENLYVSLLTNGTLLNKKCSEELLDAGLDMLWISMDGFTKESYEKIQLGSRFDLIMQNIHDFNEVRRGTEIKLGITFVVTPENTEQLEKINEFADKISADMLNISHMIPGTAIEKEKLLNLYGREDIPVGKMYRYTGAAGNVEENICPFIHERSLFVRWDGEVQPCMQLLHSCYTYLYEEKRKITSVSYGNITEKNLTEIWNTKDYADFRKRVDTFYFPFCRVCFGCEDRKENLTDCFLGEAPACGACLWASGKVFCP